jgi:chromosome segregation ATPase
MSTHKNPLSMSSTYNYNSQKKNNYLNFNKTRNTIGIFSSLNQSQNEHSSDFTTKLLEKQIYQLEEEINVLESMKNTNFGLEQEVQLLQNELSQVEELNKKRSAEYEQEIYQTKQVMNSVLQEKSQNEKQLCHIEQEIENLCDMFDRKENAYQVEESFLKELDTNLMELQETANSLESQMQELKIDLEGKLELNKEYKDKIAEYESQNQEISKQNQELTSGINQIDRTLKRTDNETFDFELLVSKKEKHLREFETENEYLEKEIELIKDETDDLELEINDINLQIDNLKLGNGKIDYQKNEQQEQVTQLRTNKINLLTNIEDKRNEIRNANQELDDLEFQLRNLDVVDQTLQIKKEQAFEEAEKLSREVQKQKGVNDKVKQIVQGQKYLEGLLRVSTLKNKETLHNI